MLDDCLFNLLFFYLSALGAFHDHFPIYPFGTFDQRRKHVDSLQHSPANANANANAYANDDGHGCFARYGIA